MVAIEGVRGGKGDFEGRSQLRRRTTGKRYAAFAVAAFDVRDPGEHAFLTTRGGAIDQITQIAGGGIVGILFNFGDQNGAVFGKDASFGTLASNHMALCVFEFSLRSNELPVTAVGVGRALKLLYALCGEHEGGRGVCAGGKRIKNALNGRAPRKRKREDNRKKTAVGHGFSIRSIKGDR